ncbi:hypothetical protein [Yersinia kristensenii]|uniref:hypothetical protein n=1 Tax=Yersinia kristensenii TaxID=28152 RepID=UPI0005E9CBA9|nr:hypothetical protein [Yersinia kristensenii]CNF34517.1 Oxygen-regulated invasion protein OrgB [Yersinia kristensenii]
MQNETINFNALDIQENVLMSGACKRSYKKAKTLVEQARYHAKGMINAAHHDAEAIYHESHRIGYERGLLLGVDTIAQFINNKNRHMNEIHSQLRDEFKALIIQAVDTESVLLALFENWVDGIEKKDDTVPFYILLPATSRRYKKKLKQYINDTHQGSVVFEYHQDSRYVFKYREQLVEFAPDSVIDTQIDGLLKNKDIYSLSETLFTEALYQLNEHIQKYFPPANMNSLENKFNDNDNDNDGEQIDDDD